MTLNINRNDQINLFWLTYQKYERNTSFHKTYNFLENVNPQKQRFFQQHQTPLHRLTQKTSV